MPMETFRSVVRRKEGLAVELETRGFKITLDEPEEMGGTNLGMNPVEVLLGGLGACQAIIATMYAPQMGIVLEDFWVEVEGDIDTDSFMNTEGVEKGFQVIRLNFHIKCDASEEKTNEFIELVESVCPVGVTLAKNVKFATPTITIEN